ncbi:hypothetical protein RND81_04G194100 [Saponaria officinalis]|uniref:C-myc binding protein n=1 Tax=Saponaria officinalis TaxID=3572 RepID=A0AAW1LN05_SAPOF
MMEKEAKKEAFRRYLESSGAVDALTKVLVALYEQHNKPASAVEFLQQKLGGPSIAEYEKLQADMSELQSKYNELVAAHQETCRQVRCVAVIIRDTQVMSDHSFYSLLRRVFIS